MRFGARLWVCPHHELAAAIRTRSWCCWIPASPSAPAPMRRRRMCLSWLDANAARRRPGHRLRLRLGHPGHRGTEARRRARLVPRHRSAGAARHGARMHRPMVLPMQQSSARRSRSCPPAWTCCWRTSSPDRCASWRRCLPRWCGPAATSSSPGSCSTRQAEVTAAYDAWFDTTRDCGARGLGCLECRAPRSGRTDRLGPNAVCSPSASKCNLRLTVTATDLRAAQGYVRCGRCHNVFNALAALADDPARQAVPASTADTQQRPVLTQPEPPHPEPDRDRRRRDLGRPMPRWNSIRHRPTSTKCSSRRRPGNAPEPLNPSSWSATTPRPPRNRRSAAGPGAAGTAVPPRTAAVPGRCAPPARTAEPRSSAAHEAPGAAHRGSRRRGSGLAVSAAAAPDVTCAGARCERQCARRRRRREAPARRGAAVRHRAGAPAALGAARPSPARLRCA